MSSTRSPPRPLAHVIAYTIACRLGCAALSEFRFGALSVLALTVTGLLCSAIRAAQPAPGQDVPAFSNVAPASTLPGRWIPFRVAPWKTRTEYTLVAAQDGTTVLRALARRSASGLVTAVDVDPEARPMVSWRWRVTEIVKGADNARRGTEDAAARLMLEFDGDEDGNADLASATRFMRLLAEPTTPHRVLMYIWSSSNPVASMLVGPLSDHIRMIVVASGPKDIGSWQAHTRNYRTDYLRAFGRAPGRLTAIAVMSDADNTGASAEAFFGDITLGPDQRTPP